MLTVLLTALGSLSFKQVLTLVLCGVLIFGVLAFAGHERAVGQRKALERIDEANKSAKERADKAQITADDCYKRGDPWVWDRSSGLCRNPRAGP